MSVKMTVFPSDKKQGPCDQVFAVEEAKKALNFHQGLEGYKPTPLCNLTALAEKLGIAGLYVKDESKRFGLNAFKGLGGSYALGRVIADKLGKDVRFRLAASPLLLQPMVTTAVVLPGLQKI